MPCKQELPGPEETFADRLFWRFVDVRHQNMKENDAVYKTISGRLPQPVFKEQKNDKNEVPSWTSEFNWTYKNSDMVW